MIQFSCVDFNIAFDDEYYCENGLIGKLTQFGNFHSIYLINFLYMTQFTNIVHKISYFVCQISIYALILLMVLTCIDVFGRYLFNLPFVGAQEILEQSMIVLIFGAMGYTTYQRAHIRADLLNSALSPQGFIVYNVFGLTVALAIVGIWTWRTGFDAVNAFINSRDITLIIGIPRAPFYAFAAFGLLITSLEMLLDIIRSIVEGRAGIKPKSTEEDLERLSIS